MKIHNATYIQVDNQNIIYSLGYFRVQNWIKQQILVYDKKNYPLKLTEPRYYSYMYHKLGTEPIENLHPLLDTL